MRFAESTSNPRASLLILGLLVAAIGPSAVALDGSWIFDDKGIIVSNPYVHGFGHWGHWFTSHFWDVSLDGEGPQHATFWRPLVLASYALDWTIGGGSPFAFHVTNLLLHAIAMVMSFVVLRRWLNAPVPAFLVTVLLALHPFRTESVAWISGRPDPLMMIGVLLALQGIALRLRGQSLGVGLEVVGAAIAYMSKEHAVVLPVLALVEVWVASRRGRSNVKYALFLWGCGPPALVASGYVALRQVLLPMNLGMGSDWSIWIRIGVILETLGRYATVLVWPKDLTFGAALIYLEGRTPLFDPFSIGVGVTTAAMVFGGLFWGWKRKPLLSLGLLVFVGTMLPILNVFSVGYYVFGSPRLLYLPSFALAFVVGIGIASLQPGRFRTPLHALVLALSLLLGAAHARRAMDYRSEDRFWSLEAERNPQYFPAVQYFTVRALRAGRPREALRLAHLGFADVRTTLGTDAAPNFLVYALAAVVRLVPDLDQATLLDIHAFLARARAGEAASLDLPTFGLRMELAAGSPDARPLRLEMGRVVAIEVGVRVRKWREVQEMARGVLETTNDAGLLHALAKQAAQSHDFEFVSRAVQRLAQGGFLGEARELKETARLFELANTVDESKAIPLRATFYARSLAWGKAYSIVQPHFDPTQAEAAGIIPIVAEVAYRAGDESRARALLADRDGVEELIAGWSSSMQWTDAPLKPGEHPLPTTLSANVMEDLAAAE